MHAPRRCRAPEVRIGASTTYLGCHALKAIGVHAVIGGVALPNEKACACTRKFGFEKCAHFRDVGFKFERRIDVAYWERLL